MASGYVDRLGLDLDDVFSPLVLVEKAPDVGYAVGGEDISNRYLPLYAGTRTHVTGYQTGDADLNTIFGVLEGPTPGSFPVARSARSSLLLPDENPSIRRGTTVYGPLESITILGDQSAAPVLQILPLPSLVTAVFYQLYLVDEVGTPLPFNRQPETWADSTGTAVPWAVLVEAGLTEGWTPALPPGASIVVLETGAPTDPVTFSASPTDVPGNLVSFTTRLVSVQARFSPLSDQLDQSAQDGSAFIPSSGTVAFVEGAVSNTLEAMDFTSWRYAVGDEVNAPNLDAPDGILELGSLYEKVGESAWANAPEDVLTLLNALIPSENTVLATVFNSGSSIANQYLSQMAPVSYFNARGVADAANDVYISAAEESSFDYTTDFTFCFPAKLGFADGLPDPYLILEYQLLGSAEDPIPFYYKLYAPRVSTQWRIEPPSDT